MSFDKIPMSSSMGQCIQARTLLSCLSCSSDTLLHSALGSAAAPRAHEPFGADELEEEVVQDQVGFHEGRSLVEMWLAKNPSSSYSSNSVM